MPEPSYTVSVRWADTCHSVDASNARDCVCASIIRSSSISSAASVAEAAGSRPAKPSRYVASSQLICVRSRSPDTLFIERNYLFNTEALKHHLPRRPVLTNCQCCDLRLLQLPSKRHPSYCRQTARCLYSPVRHAVSVVIIRGLY